MMTTSPPPSPRVLFRTSNSPVSVMRMTTQCDTPSTCASGLTNESESGCIEKFAAVVSDSEEEEEENIDELCCLSLPPEVWAMALDYLPYQSILSCAATSRSMLNDVLPLVSTVYIDKSSQLQLGTISRQLRDVRSVHIFSLFNNTNSNDDQEGIGLDHDTATMAVPFLSRLPQLESVYFGGRKSEKLCRLGALTRLSGRLSLRADEEASLNHLTEAFSGHFVCKALPQRLRVVGLRCPEYHESNNMSESCGICSRACKRFPLDHVMSIDLCLSMDKCRSIVESRPGGKEYLLSSARFLQLLGKGQTFNSGSDFTIIGFGRETRDEMESFIQQSDFDVTNLDPSDVSNAIEKYNDKCTVRKTLYLCKPSFDYLKADLGLPIADELLDPEAICIENLFRMVKGVMTIHSPLHNTRQIHRLLCLENPPVQQVIDSGVLPRIIEFLQRDDDSELQFEAACVLTNIVSGDTEQVGAVVRLGAIPHLIHVLGSPDEHTSSQAAWALGNIAADGPGYRDLVLQAGAIQPMCQHLHQWSDLNTARVSTWALMTFCQGEPKPDFNFVRHSLPMLSKLVSNPDPEVSADACSALSHLSNGPAKEIQEVIEALGETGGHCIVQMLQDPSPDVQVTALRVVGNIATGNDSQTQFIINNKALPCLLPLLSSKTKEIVKGACWCISSITAGSKDQIQAVIDHQFIPPLIHLLNNGQIDVRREAVWALSNLAYRGSRKQIKFLVDHGCIGPLCDLLTADDDEMVAYVLYGLKEILKVGAVEANAKGCQNQMSLRIIEAEGLTKIKALGDHGDGDIQNKSISILQRYFADLGFTN